MSCAGKAWKARAPRLATQYHQRHKRYLFLALANAVLPQTGWSAPLPQA